MEGFCGETGNLNGSVDLQDAESAIDQLEGIRQEEDEKNKGSGSRSRWWAMAARWLRALAPASAGALAQRSLRAIGARAAASLGAAVEAGPELSGLGAISERPRLAWGKGSSACDQRGLNRTAPIDEDEAAGAGVFRERRSGTP